MYFRAGWLVIAMLAFGNAGAQPAGEDDHIRWQFSSLRQSDSVWKLLFTAVIDPGWHLYSQSTPRGGPMPVVFEFSKAGGFRLVGSVREVGMMKKGFDEVFMVDVKWYEGNVVFTQEVKVSGGGGKNGRGGKGKVTGEISYSVCSGEMCMPGNVRFSLDVGD